MPSTNTYECPNCGARIDADSHPGECEDCGGELRNISTPRGR
jgi:predicted nucleic acid-binding Zn ribbon protein